MNNPSERQIWLIAASHPMVVLIILALTSFGFDLFASGIIAGSVGNLMCVAAFLPSRNSID